MEKQFNSENQLVKVIVEGIQDKKGSQISVLDLRKLEHAVCDYFVICDANSTTQVSAIADGVEESTIKKMKEKALHKEGAEHSSWILLDYGDVVVHVFLTESRTFYNLEGFWADAENIELNENH